jgi:tetratricopeptide (TPR) repeat protein
MGESFYRYGNYTESRDAFTRIVQKYPTSDFYPDSLYKLELIGYKQERFTEAIFYHQKILMEFPSAEFIDAANYFGGICRYSIGEFNEAIEVLSKVNTMSDYYAFSQYTMALCYLQRDDVEGAITQLNKIFNIETRSDIDEAIKDLTHVTLGRLYYEMGKYEQAINEYERVDSGDNENYDDAVLGIGWVYVKQFEYDKALDMFSRIINGMPQSELVAEAKLSSGHCYLGVGDYDKAIDIYRDVKENYSISDEIEGDPRIAEIFQEISIQMTKADELYYNLIELDKIALSKGREDLHRRIIQEKEEVQRIQDLLAGLEMWFSGRSTTGRNLVLGAEFGIATIAFEKSQDLEEKILEISEETNLQVSKLREKEEELLSEQQEEIVLEKESDIGYRESLKGNEGISILEKRPDDYNPDSPEDFSKELRIPVGVSEELEDITYVGGEGNKEYESRSIREEESEDKEEVIEEEIEEEEVESEEVMDEEKSDTDTTTEEEDSDTEVDDQTNNDEETDDEDKDDTKDEEEDNTEENKEENPDEENNGGGE